MHGASRRNPFRQLFHRDVTRQNTTRQKGNCEAAMWVRASAWQRQAAALRQGT